MNISFVEESLPGRI